MPFRTVTFLCLIAAAVSLVMSLFGQFLFSWLFQHSDMEHETLRMIQGIYYPITVVVHDGSLLLFFITLHSRQKAPAKQA